MNRHRLISLVIVLGMAAVLLIACGSPAPQPPNNPGVVSTPNASAPNAASAHATPEKINADVGPNDPQIYMLEPLDGASLNSPFFLRIGVINFPIPISNVKIHVAINTACTPAGQPIPEDEQHVSLPLGELSMKGFNLPLGPQRLCFQASNQNNIALQGPGMTRMIDVVVKSVYQPGAS